MTYRYPGGQYGPKHRFHQVRPQRVSILYREPAGPNQLNLRDDFSGPALRRSSLSPSSLELTDTKVYEPEMRALLETASHFCKAVVLESRPLTSSILCSHTHFKVRPKPRMGFSGNGSAGGFRRRSSERRCCRRDGCVTNLVHCIYIDMVVSPAVFMICTFI